MSRYVAFVAVMTLGGLSGIGFVRVGAQDVPIILADAASFDVVSVKPSPPNVQFPGIRPIGPGGRFTAVGLTPRALAQLAYGRDGALLQTQIISDAKWLDTEQFDIVGTSAALTATANPFGVVRGLLQTLLRERLQARMHADTRTLPTFELVLARRDGKTGPQLLPATAPCAPMGTAPSSDVPRCGFTRVAPGQWSARSLDLGVLATTLAHQPDVGRVVRNQTGLRGRFDVELRFSTQLAGAANTNADPDLFTALQEQLGLKLESSRGPVEVIVVDQIERPTAD
jgi:uncharacterized protein (TIGR03435 family)